MTPNKKLTPQFHIKNISYAGKAIIATFTKTIESLLKRLPDVQKADITIKSNKKGSLYEAVVAVVQKGRKGFAIRVSSPDLYKVLLDVHKKLRSLVKR